MRFLKKVGRGYPSTSKDDLAEFFGDLLDHFSLSSLAGDGDGRPVVVTGQHGDVLHPRLTEFLDRISATFPKSISYREQTEDAVVLTQQHHGFAILFQGSNRLSKFTNINGYFYKEADIADENCFPINFGSGASSDQGFEMCRGWEIDPPLVFSTMAFASGCFDHFLTTAGLAE